MLELFADHAAATLVQACEAAPDAAGPMLALADRLDDLGIEPDLAHALRWCDRRGRRPMLDSRRPRPWAWWRDGATARGGRAILPDLVWRACLAPRLRANGGGVYSVRFAGWEQAIDWLAAGLRHLRDTWEGV